MTVMLRCGVSGLRDKICEAKGLQGVLYGCPGAMLVAVDEALDVLRNDRHGEGDGQEEKQHDACTPGNPHHVAESNRSRKTVSRAHSTCLCSCKQPRDHAALEDRKNGGGGTWRGCIECSPGNAHVSPVEPKVEEHREHNGGIHGGEAAEKAHE